MVIKMKETSETKEIHGEQEQFKNISGLFEKVSENLSVATADEKLASRIEIGASPDKIEKQTAAAKKEINELLAEKYNTSPTFEELRSKSKINKLSTLEKIQYAQLSLIYPERAEISKREQSTTNLNYEEAKKYHIDFQVLDTLKMLNAEYKQAKAGGTALTPRESDLRDKLTDIYATKLGDHYDELITRTQELLART